MHPCVLKKRLCFERIQYTPTIMFKKIVFLGDSITEGFGDEACIGWPGRIAQKLHQTSANDDIWTIANLGVGGDTVLDCKHRLASGILTRDVTHITLSFGTNDGAIALWPNDEGPHLSFANAKINWIRIFETLKMLPVKVAVIGTLPVIEEKFPFVYIPRGEGDNGFDFKNAHQKRTNAFLKELCDEYALPFIDLFDDWAQRDLSALLPDGLHPNGKGYDLLSEQIHDALTSHNFYE